MKTCNCIPDKYGHMLDCDLLTHEMGLGVNDSKYSKGYSDGYADAEKHYTNRCILCGTGGIASPSLCIPCKEEHPYWMGE